jgi:hypothetical protein
VSGREKTGTQIETGRIQQSAKAVDLKMPEGFWRHTNLIGLLTTHEASNLKATKQAWQSRGDGF